MLSGKTSCPVGADKPDFRTTFGASTVRAANRSAVPNANVVRKSVVSGGCGQARFPDSLWREHSARKRGAAKRGAAKTQRGQTQRGADYTSG